MRNKTQNIPFRRNVPNPFNAAVLHRPIPTDTLGDCLRNDRLFQLFVFFNGRTGLFQYSVNFGALRIQKGRNAILLGKWRNWNLRVCKINILDIFFLLEYPLLDYSSC